MIFFQLLKTENANFLFDRGFFWTNRKFVFNIQTKCQRHQTNPSENDFNPLSLARQANRVEGVSHIKRFLRQFQAPSGTLYS